MRPPTRLLIQILIAGIFLWAAFAKLHAGQNGGIPTTIYEQWSHASPAHYGIICFEFALGGWLLSNRGTRYVAASVVIILSTLSGLIAVELTRDHPQPCGCLGPELVAALSPAAIRRSLAWSLTRNILLIAAALWLYFDSGRKRDRSDGSPLNETTPTPPLRGKALTGFSLVELLVVIGIISVMVSLLLPSLAKSRRQAESIVCLSNLRQLGMALNTYADQNQDNFPTWSGWQVYPNGSSPEDESGLGWTEQIMPNFVPPTNPVYRCPAFPPEAQINYFLDVRWLGIHDPEIPCLHRPQIKRSSQFILSGDCTGRNFYSPPFGIALDHATTDCDKTDEGFKALVFSGESGGINMHPGGNNVLFADGHADTFPSFDPQRMTFNPQSLQNWEDTTPE